MFNKIIDLTLSGDQVGSFSIKTPRKGAKPYISVNANLTSSDVLSALEIRVANLYTNKALEKYHNVYVKAGYEGSESQGFAGSIAAMYTESPGPDKITVISCLTARFSEWMNATVNLNYDKGVPVDTVVNAISKSLGFNTPQIDPEAGAMTLSAPFCVNGTARQAVDELKSMTSLQITIDSNRIYVTGKDTKAAKLHVIPYIIQAPQFTGSSVSFSAPWKPEVKPGDFVKFPTDFYKTQLGDAAIVKNIARVLSVNVNFATSGSTNEMVVTGVVG